MPGPNPPSSRVVVPVVAGIGNALMTQPLVRAIAAGRDARVLARTKAIAEVFEDVCPATVLPTTPLAARRELRSAAKGHTLVLPFPANRWQYVLLAAAAGARRVVTHRYPVGRVSTGRFVLDLTRRIRATPARAGRHDVDQNLDLADLLNLDAAPSLPTLHPKPHDESAADALLPPDFPRHGFVAVVPGCGDTPVGRAKRPPPDFFARLVAGVRVRGLPVAVLEGPDEPSVASGIVSRSGLADDTGVAAVRLGGRLHVAAAVLARAGVVVAVDSGLGHMAAAAGTRVVSLFAAADPSRCRPAGPGHKVIVPRPAGDMRWQPRLRYPLDAAGPRLTPSDVDWTLRFDAADVLAAVLDVTAPPVPAAE